MKELYSLGAGFAFRIAFQKPYSEKAANLTEPAQALNRFPTLIVLLKPE